MAHVPFLETLRARLLGVVLLVIVAAVGVTIYTASEQRTQARARAALDARRLANLNGAVLGRLLEVAQLLLTTAGQVADLGEPASCGSRFAAVHRSHQMLYANAGVADTRGHVLCSSAPLPELTDRQWFHAAREHGVAVAWDPSAGGLVIAQRRPASDGNPLVFFVAVRPEWVTRLTIDSRVPADGVITLMDGDGQVIVQRSDAAWEARPFATPDAVEAVRAGEVEDAEMVGVDGVAGFYAFSTVHRLLDRSLVVGIGVPTTSVDGGGGQRLGRNLGVLGFIAVVALGLAWILGEVTIGRRVNRLAAATRELTAGNLSRRSGVPGGRDELGVLASHFDEMAASLERQELESRASTEALRKLTHRLQSVREDEQFRIAREIHDQLGQVMTALKMDTANIRRQVGAAHPGVTERLGDMMAVLDTAAETVRRISGELRPPLLEDLGLAAALEWQGREFAGRSGVELAMDVAGDLPHLPLPVATGLFRIAQEALTNVARHARATRVAVRLRWQDGAIELEIEDNGVGFVVSERPLTLGLLGMRERAELLGGTLTVTAKPRQGTRVTVRVPIDPRGDA